MTVGRHLPRLDDRAGSGSPLLLAATARHEGLAGHRDDIAIRTENLRTPMRDARAHTPDPETRSRSRPTSATVIGSIPPSPTSPNATPTRTTMTTGRSPRPSAPGESRQSKASKAVDGIGQAAQPSTMGAPGRTGDLDLPGHPGPSQEWRRLFLRTLARVLSRACRRWRRHDWPILSTPSAGPPRWVL